MGGHDGAPEPVGYGKRRAFMNLPLVNAPTVAGVDEEVVVRLKERIFGAKQNAPDSI